MLQFESYQNLKITSDSSVVSIGFEVEVERSRFQSLYFSAVTDFLFT